MNTYPTSLPLAAGTNRAVRSAVRNRVASNLAVRPRAIASSEFYDPIVLHRGLTETQFGTFTTFYHDNMAIRFTYTLPDGTTMTCVFADSPFDVQSEPTLRGLLYHLTVRMLQAA